MLADAVPQIICTAGADGKVDYFNRRWFEFTGLSDEQTFEDDGWLTAFHPEDRSLVVAGWRAAAKDGSDFSVEARVRSRTGEYRWFLERAVALRTEDGSVIRLFATATDIDEPKRVEEREKFLSHVSEVLGSTLDPGILLQKITELCVPTFADWCQVQSLTADNELIVEAVRHSDPKLNARLESLVGRPVVFIHETSLGSPHVLQRSPQRRTRSRGYGARGSRKRSRSRRPGDLRGRRFGDGVDRAVDRARSNPWHAASRERRSGIAPPGDHARYRRRVGTSRGACDR